jgi:hypothetical protein
MTLFTKERVLLAAVSACAVPSALFAQNVPVKVRTAIVDESMSVRSGHPE